MDWLRAILDAFVRVFVWWKSSEDAARNAQNEQAAEIAAHDRAKANAIRDRVDSARLGGGLHKPDDTRGYRAD